MLNKTSGMSILLRKLCRPHQTISLTRHEGLRGAYVRFDAQANTGEDPAPVSGFYIQPDELEPVALLLLDIHRGNQVRQEAA